MAQTQTTAQLGFRGYMSARNLLERSVSQHLQQLIMRTYCVDRHMLYHLAGFEYTMPGSTMVLDNLLHELPQLDGIVMFSVGTMPMDFHKRRAVYERIFSLGKTLHFAAEGLKIASPADTRAIEEGFIILDIMRSRTDV